MNDTVEIKNPSMLNKLKKIASNRQFQIGAAVVTTAVVTVLVLRTDAVLPKAYTLEEITDLATAVTPVTETV